GLKLLAFHAKAQEYRSIMTNEKLKSILGWFIILSQVALLLAIFVLSMGQNKKLNEEERNALIAAIIPSLGIYGTAAVMFMFQGTQSPARQAWREQRAPKNRIAATILLPPIPFLMNVYLIVQSGYGNISPADLISALPFVQTFESIFVTFI